MATIRDHSAPDVADREIVNIRVFDCSPERLFRTWTEPTELANEQNFDRLEAHLAGRA
jgi:hypothetical protein